MTININTIPFWHKNTTPRLDILFLLINIHLDNKTWYAVSPYNIERSTMLKTVATLSLEGTIYIHMDTITFWLKNTTQLLKWSNATHLRSYRSYSFVQWWWVYSRRWYYAHTMCHKLSKPGALLLPSPYTSKISKMTYMLILVSSLTILPTPPHHNYNVYCCIKPLCILLCPREYPYTTPPPLK